MDKIGDDFEKSVENLTETFIEDLTTEDNADLEPFESYAHRIRAQIHQNVDDFKHHFAHGYEVIIEELLEEKRHEHQNELKTDPLGQKVEKSNKNMMEKRSKSKK